MAEERVYRIQIGAQDRTGEEHVELIEVTAENEEDAREYGLSECDRRFPPAEGYYRQRVHVIPPEEEAAA